MTTDEKTPETCASSDPAGDAAPPEDFAPESLHSEPEPGTRLGPPGRLDAERAVWTLLSYIGEDPRRAGLRDTPARVVRSLEDMTRGLREPHELKLTLFGLVEADPHEPVIVRGIEFSSLCEHHLLPFVGKADLAYLPVNRHVLGLSKLARLVQHHAARPQVQERLTAQIAADLGRAAAGLPLGPPKAKPARLAAHQQPVLHSFARLVAKHGCMHCRGVRTSAKTITTIGTGKLAQGETLRGYVERQLGNTTY